MYLYVYIYIIPAVPVRPLVFAAVQVREMHVI